MKKIIFPVVMAAILFVSCKKENRVCQCTFPDGSESYYTFTDRTSKKEAKFACEGTDNIRYTNDGENYTDIDKTCTLK